jgi:hypothetical protein
LPHSLMSQNNMRKREMKKRIGIQKVFLDKASLSKRLKYSKHIVQNIYCYYWTSPLNCKRHIISSLFHTNYFTQISFNRPIILPFRLKSLCSLVYTWHFPANIAIDFLYCRYFLHFRPLLSRVYLPSLLAAGV